MWNQWNAVFRKTLGHAERQPGERAAGGPQQVGAPEAFCTDDAYRRSTRQRGCWPPFRRPQADEIEQMKMELLRVRFDEQVRSEKRKSAGTAIESAATGSLKPWREVVTPHPDVASGPYQQAEFAADLWQVHLGEGSDEYRDPVEFFRRTFLTEGLKQLWWARCSGWRARAATRSWSSRPTSAAAKRTRCWRSTTCSRRTAPQRTAGGGGRAEGGGRRPAAQACSGGAGRQQDLARQPSRRSPTARWCGRCGASWPGSSAARRPTSAFEADDERATNPGDALRELFNKYGPCLILIDEWVAYARQLHDQGDLPGGSFETHFTFAQALTEAAKAGAELPAGDQPASLGHAGSPHTQADDVEVGGERGREALDRLRNAVGRVEASWRPASAEEGFEIVRRRLFEPLTDQAQFMARDTVARAFADLYRTQHQEFPPECRDADYEKRIKAAYPIHPEIFDRLYKDWSTLVKFQRTRGVLRLMAAVIHCLWEKDDKQPADPAGQHPRSTIRGCSSS